MCPHQSKKKKKELLQNRIDLNNYVNMLSSKADIFI